MSDSDSTVFKFCKKCQCETARYAKGGCKPCANRRSAKSRQEKPELARLQKIAWASKNKEQISAQKKSYYAANREKIRALQTENAKINPERKKEYNAIWKANNKERIKLTTASRYKEKKDVMRAQAEAWKAGNLDKVRELSSRWRKENKTKIKTYRQNRRASCSGQAISTGAVERLLTLQRGKCACCGLPLGDNYHMDHIMPLALGGSNTDDNIQLLRQRCNLQKSKKHPVDFMQSRGFLL